jgi:hypothetical protein
VHDVTDAKMATHPVHDLNHVFVSIVDNSIYIYELMKKNSWPWGHEVLPGA